MKIIYLHQYFVTPKESGGTRSYEFAKRLVSMGHEVTIVTSYMQPYRNRNWFQTNDSGITIHWLPLRYSNYSNFLERIKVFLIFSWKSFLKIKKIEGDLIFATSTPLTIAMPAIFISKKKKYTYGF